MNKGVILITGSTGGIGSALVELMLTKGYSVIAAGRDIKLLEKAFKNTSNCHLLETNLDEENSIYNSMNYIRDTYGELRGFVHCAGYDKLSPLYLTKTKDLEQLFKVHTFAPIKICSILAKKGYAQEGCSIVLLSSLAAHEGARGHSSYAAAKGALEGFLPSAASELIEKNIRINIVIPGVVATKMSDGFISKLDKVQFGNLVKGYPLGLSDPVDIAALISFLISEDSKKITGQKFIIDGGHSVRSV